MKVLKYKKAPKLKKGNFIWMIGLNNNNNKKKSVILFNYFILLCIYFLIHY